MPSSKTVVEGDLMLRDRRYTRTDFKLKITTIYFQKLSVFEISMKNSKTKRLNWKNKQTNKINKSFPTNFILWFATEQIFPWLITHPNTEQQQQNSKPEFCSTPFSLLGAKENMLSWKVELPGLEIKALQLTKEVTLPWCKSEDSLWTGKY